MPYIPQSERVKFDYSLNNLRPISKGQLTYCVYKLVLDFMSKAGSDVSYAGISNAISALPDAEHELRRRILDPYEDAKRKENGDI